MTDSGQSKSTESISSSTERARKYLIDLKAVKGKRLLVDLDQEGKEALWFLIKNGYASSQKDAVIKALIAAKITFDKRDPSLKMIL